mmetsp:Transcript_58023/g.138117  ORF Transcript_58023/g.138117 Transcript_58023/m.138117 type:complete len:86 (-) Transcript_58023:39-296(-)
MHPTWSLPSDITILSIIHAPLMSCRDFAESETLCKRTSGVRQLFIVSDTVVTVLWHLLLHGSMDRMPARIAGHLHQHLCECACIV